MKSYRSQLANPNHQYQLNNSQGTKISQLNFNGDLETKLLNPELIQSKKIVKKNKKQFIQPGNPCQCFEQILSTTLTCQNGINTYLIAKALTGPALAYASQKSKQIPPVKNVKTVPQLPKGISGQLGSNLNYYSTLTHPGLYRKSNQDKLTIYLQDDFKWFGIYDGHGGTSCSQFLKQHLHQYFLKQNNWQQDIPTALRNAFIQAQKNWKQKGDNSGSCVCVVFIYQNIAYCANLGDSRAILISQNGTKCYQISKDHKPCNPQQQKRIIQAGGKIYQTTAITQIKGHYDQIVGPLRILPGRLSTTRTIGDFQGKQQNQQVVIAQPQITSFQIYNHQYILLGSDGLFDCLSNTLICDLLTNSISNQNKNNCQILAKASQILVGQAIARGSADNISVIIVGLNDGQNIKVQRKGNQDIKILGKLNTIKKKKQNNYPQKLKQIDSKIQQINKNTSRLAQSRR